MEQHNIDSRFKKGLENLERQPSADAWARLQSQMNSPQILPETETLRPDEKEEKRILVWWQYAAAAVVLLFVSFGILKNGMLSGENTAESIAVHQPTELPEPGKNTTDVPALVLQQESSSDNAIATVATSNIHAETETGNVSKIVVKTTLAEAPKTHATQIGKKAKSEKTFLSEPVKSETAEMKPVPEEVLMASNQTKPVSNPETTGPHTSGLEGMAIEVIVKRDNPTNALAVTNPPADGGKDSKLKNIFRQAKNLKNGEGVDLQALGLSPGSKLAVGTRNLQQKFSKVLDI